MAFGATEMTECLFRAVVPKLYIENIQSIRQQLFQCSLPEPECAIVCEALENYLQTEESNQYRSRIHRWCIHKESLPTMDYIEIIQTEVGPILGKYWSAYFRVPL